MQVNINVIAKLKSWAMSANGATECSLGFEKFNSKDCEELSFRLDCGADRTHTSIYRLMYYLGYTSQYIKDRLEHINGQTSTYADGRKVFAYFIRVPYIAFLDSYLVGENSSGFPIYVDCPQDSSGNILYDEIDQIEHIITDYRNNLISGTVTVEQVDAIENLERKSADNLLGLDIKYQYLWVHDPTKWCVDAYSIEKPVKDISIHNKIIKVTATGTTSPTIQHKPLSPDAQAMLKIIQCAYPVTKLHERCEANFSIGVKDIEAAVQELLDVELITVNDDIYKSKI